MTTTFDLFIKLMQVTTSDLDGEALSALRKANGMLAKQGMNWEELLKAKVKLNVVGEESKAPPSKGKHHTDEDEINLMFEALLDDVPHYSSFREYVEEVHTWWEEKGFLTDPQYQAIKRSFERI